MYMFICIKQRTISMISLYKYLCVSFAGEKLREKFEIFPAIFSKGPFIKYLRSQTGGKWYSLL